MRSMTLYIYILTVLSFVILTIFLGLYHYHFVVFTIVRFCYIVLYIKYYIVNTQFSLVAASFLQINYISIYLSTEQSFLEQSITGKKASEKLCKLMSTFP